AVPRWAFTMVTAVVLLGFPIALVLAWAFETSPEGVKRTEPARRGELDAIVGQPGVKRWPAGVLALVGTLLLLGAG
ncbi:MAG: hypothetical protein GWN99_12885, partial [Gemmatimonadetes bacterium]|nr:hypothetical protein [Gemmatimonadota bacterium]NIS01941.1 hypothetical protein [Gemmatimonadota bacterium]NIT68343.1 hypothetical protein [Gemmatimonadota bacterium]NIV25443.1 hypothetical protein [Gemmatimonadota bacterium]NIW77489.1 hypothetical protein [Gemmatimonadota bacterium]